MVDEQNSQSAPTGGDSLTLEEAAVRLRVSIQTLRNYANAAIGYRRNAWDDPTVIRTWPAMVNGRARIVYSRQDVEAIAALKGL